MSKAWRDSRAESLHEKQNVNFQKKKRNLALNSLSFKNDKIV
jgi:hypothetical protein